MENPNLRQLRRAADAWVNDHRNACRDCGTAAARLEKAEKELAVSEQAQKILQELSAEIQQQAHTQIARVVTSCLETVYEADAYTFQINFEQKRGKTEAVMSFVQGEELIDPLGSAFGGSVDVAAFALRVASLVLEQPEHRRLMVLDEPFRFVSRDHAPRVRALLESLSRDLGIQFIIVTHNPALAAGRVVELG